jgi:exodeoxyribonuclease V beta subunit
MTNGVHEPPVFELRGPLPQGVMVLEASAGTGKTYAIAALATRYVAAGVPLSELLIVTFTNLATAELRVRVRERLTGARDAIEAALAGAARATDDEVLDVLVDAPEHVLRLRHALMVRALADFDAATITTIHGFCQEVLKGLGVSSDIDRAFGFTENARDLTDEVVDDLYVRGFRTCSPRFLRRQARDVVLEAVENPTTRLVPDDAPPGSDAAMRYRLAVSARNEVDRRKRAGAIMTFDDLLTRAAIHAHGPRRWRRGGSPPSRRVSRGTGGRVPGHRPRPMGDPAPRLRARGRHADPHRRSKAGDLRLPRRRRLCLLEGAPNRRLAGDPADEPPQRPGVARRL